MTPFGDYEKKNIAMFRKSKSHLLIKELEYIDIIQQDLVYNKDIYNNIEYSFCKIKDVRNTVKRLVNKNILDEVELFEIKNLAIISENIRNNYEKLNLDINYINFKSIEEVINILDPDHLNLPTFHIYESYSQNLKEIRKLKSNIENKILNEENYEEIEKLKIERLNIVVEEEKEEIEIKKKISYLLNNYVNYITDNIKCIGKLDLLIAKAKLAMKYNAIKPNINNNNRIYFENLNNPQIDEILSKNNKTYTPISIDINNKITLITGANMGGKSVSMKTIVLNLYLFQCGFYVFAEEADLPILDFIYLISDDMQDVNRGLSTFGAEIIKLKEIINVMKLQDGFVALDEFARGTNPKEGKILLKSICEYFKTLNSIALISTHFDDVISDDIDHYQVVGLKKINFGALKYKINLNKKDSVDILQEHMDYRLERVKKEIEVPKDALNICTLLGLQSEVVCVASKYYRGEENE